MALALSLLPSAKLVAGLQGRLLEVVQELVDRLVAQGGHADTPARPHEREGRARTAPRLAGAGWPLHEEVAPIEAQRGLGERPVQPRPRRAPLEDLDRGRVPLPVLGEAEERRPLRLRMQRLRRDERGRERLLGLLATPAELERPVLVVHVARRTPRSVFGSTPAPWILCSWASNRNGYHQDCLTLYGLAVGLEPAEGVPVRDELLVVEPAVEEVLPPLRPLLALVVVEEVGEEPVRVALLGAGEEGVADARPLGVPLLGFLAPLALLRREAPRHLRRPPLEQPAVQLVERDAVLLVVVADPVEERVVARLEPRLERVDRLAPASDVRAAARSRRAPPRP